MRSDMFKVIVERPRGGGGGCSDEPKGYRRRLARIAPDELPVFESSARYRRYGSSAKRLNENLAPLRRYLRKQVGRPWNKVHSEICEHLSLDSAVKSHVLDHVRLEVITDVVLVGKVPHHGPHSWFRAGPIVNSLYVDPNSGLLRATVQVPRRRRRKPDPAFVDCPGDADIQFHPVDGLWYEIRLAPLDRLAPYTHDVLLRRLVDPRNASGCAILADMYGRPGVYGVSKRQLNSREIRKFVPQR